MTFENEYGHMSALYGAAGVAHDPELTRVLLEAGADPDDGESLYHSTESSSTACLELLLEHGASTSDTNALAHALDDERLDHVRLLLEAGADPNEHAHVAHAVRRGRGPELIRLLAEYGAELDRPGGETWRGNVPLRTPYQHARLRARDDVAETLAELGASTELDPADAAIESLARGERPTTPLPETFDVDAQEVIVLSALGGHVDAVVEAVGSGFRGVVGGSPEGALVEHAAWVGDARLVERLLSLGAAPGAALGWAAHGSRNHSAPGGTTSQSRSRSSPRAAPSSPASWTTPKARSTRGSRPGWTARPSSSRRARSRGARAAARRAGRAAARSPRRAATRAPTGRA